MDNKKQKIIVIVGTTASGKTAVGVDLAYRFGGEVISADSRQVYKGMDIGSGKDLDEYNHKVKIKGKEKVVKIPYHLIDVVKPNTEFNLAKYQRLANKAVEDVLGRGKLPIIVGGTGLYAQSIVDGFNLHPEKVDKVFREKLEKMSVDRLFSDLEKLNKKFAQRLNNSDKNNKRRLIRYIEILKNGGNVDNIVGTKPRNDYEFLIIGLTHPQDVLWRLIHKRITDRLDNENMLGEVERLHHEGVSWKRLKSFGLEYKYLSMYLQGEIDYKKMIEDLYISTRQFAKRQLVWLRRWEKQGTKIHWMHKISDLAKLKNEFAKTKKEARDLAKEFLK